MSRKLVLGLGGCVDFEIAWEPRVLEELAGQFGIRAADLDVDVEVHDQRSLLCSILAFVRDGIGGERFISSSAIGTDFATRFTSTVTLGGTCVRAAIAIAKLGVPSTVHLVSIDDNVRRLLPQQVEYLSSATQDTLDPHLIIQYPADATVRLVDGVVQAEHPNRIIYVNDPPNRDLVLSADLPEALETADVFLVAGFNVMRDPVLLQDRLRFLQAAMTRLPHEATVFFEDAGYHDNAMRAIVGSEFRNRIDVHSMNEDELQSYLGRPVDLLDVTDVGAALASSPAFAIAPTLVIHTKFWSLAYGTNAAAYGNALEGGIDLASTRYCHGDAFTPDDLARLAKLPRHRAGSAFAAGINQRLGAAVCCVPARFLDVPAPTTIGLGDTFVGGFLAALTSPELVRSGRDRAE